MRSGRLIRSSVVLVLVCAGLSSAQLAVWVNAGKTPLWSVPENWDTGKVPIASDAVNIDLADANCVIDDSVTAVCVTLLVGNLTKTARCGLEMTGGSLTTAGNIRVAGVVDTNAVFTMSGGTVSTSNAGRLHVGMSNRSYGVFILKGGVFTASDKVEVAKEAGSTGYLYIQGGTFNLAGYGSDDFEIGTRGTGYVYMTGGVVNITDQIKLAQDASGTGVGRMYLYGGTMNASNLRPVAQTLGAPYIDIATGRLVLVGDDRPTVDEYLNKGWIVGYGGLGRVVVTYTPDPNQTVVTAARVDPEYAWNPNPGNVAVAERTPTGPILSWSPGLYAVSHDVYFGIDKDAVTQADRTWPEFKKRQALTSFDPGTLELGQTYYWRVDEVNENAWAPPGSPWKGAVWQFTVAEYLVVDNMESYGSAATPGPPPPAGSRIWYTWKDGEGWTNPSEVQGNGSGSVVDDPNRAIVHGGSQSLKVFYANGGTNLYGRSTAYYSEVRADTSHLVIGQDWTQAGVKGLSLWFYGNSANDANETERPYVKVNDVRIPYDGSMICLQEAKWHEWNVDLTAAGVDLARVTSLAIGIGNPSSAKVGGSGVVYLDDIRLYIPRCLPSLRRLAGDLDNDCDVDFADLALMAGDWLQKDFKAVGSDGLLVNFASATAQWVKDDVRGPSLQFDGVDDWVNLDDALFGRFHDRTISVWARISAFPATYPYVFSFQNAATAPYRIYMFTHGTDAVRVRFVEDYSPDFRMGADAWHHLAFVLRDTSDGLCTGEFYGDGQLVGALPGRPRHMGAASSVCLGSFGDGASGFINATCDDFRVYAKALSATEIQGLASGAGPTTAMIIQYKFDEVSGQTAKNSSTYEFARPLLSAGELSATEPEGSRSVNLLDFAVLGGTWAQVQLWP